MGSRKTVPCQPTIACVLLVASSLLFSWTAKPAITINYIGDGGSNLLHQQWSESFALGPYSGHPWQRQLGAQVTSHEFAVCGRPTNYTQKILLQQQQQQYASCPEYGMETPLLVLESYMVFVRTANQLRSLLRAIQYARDKQYKVGIMHYSWAVDVLFAFFMLNADGDWKAQAEQAMCVKIIHSPEELEGQEVIRKKYFGIISLWQS